MSDRPWTVLAYIVADDERKPDVHLNIDPLNDEADRERVALVAGAHAVPDVPVFYQIDFTADTPTVRRLLRGDSDKDCGPVDEDNVANRAALEGFFAAGVKESGGGVDSRYAVVFWGHGSGPAGLFLDAQPTTMPAQTLRIPDLKKALATLPRGYADLVMFKDCWVSTLEVAYELKDVVRYMIASQCEVPIHGAWPYANILNVLSSHTNSPGAEMLLGLLDALQQHYCDPRNRGTLRVREEVPFAALAVDAAASIAGPLRVFAGALQNPDRAFQSTVREFLNRGDLRGGNDSLIDVRNLCKAMRAADVLSNEALDLERAVNALVVDQRSQSLKGASLFCRRTANRNEEDTALEELVALFDYDELSLSAKTQWDRIAFADMLQPV